MNSFPRGKLGENCELRRTDNVQGQISEHIFAPNRDYCVYYQSNLFRNARRFENWRIFSDIPQFQLGNIRSREAFRPIARKRKDLMDYTMEYPTYHLYFPIHSPKGWCVYRENSSDWWYILRYAKCCIAWLYLFWCKVSRKISVGFSFLLAEQKSQQHQERPRCCGQGQRCPSKAISGW